MEDGIGNAGFSGRARTRSSQRCWVVTRGGSGGTEVLTDDLDGERETLPVFSFEDEAAMFLWLRTTERGWRATETTPGQLVSILYGPCAHVRRVVLDPLLEIADPTQEGPVSMDREGFLEAVVGVRSPGAAV
ncbi:MAG: hypothetical protein M3P49_17660 [Actinomycetota bacterium]|nr:hypothetical protein [Actinomycetota bacterium]